MLNFTFNLVGNERMLAVLFIFMLIDIVTGLTKGVVNHELSSTVLRKGFGKKISEVCLTVLAVLISTAFSLPAGFEVGVFVYVCYTEFVSIIENITECGLPVPEFIKKVFENRKGGE